jgi:Kef-type K+ transport system membrane component KefB
MLLLAVHAGGWLAAQLRQPRVVGELTSGVLLGLALAAGGPTRIFAALFDVDGTPHAVLSTAASTGMVLLMFLAGTEVRIKPRPGDRRLTLRLIASGLLLPLCVVLPALEWIELDGLIGPANSRTALNLVIASAIAVTSIPVITRIMLDLGVLHTSFARIVLSAAVLEDLLLYLVLAVAVAVAGGPPDGVAWLPGQLSLAPGAPQTAYHIIATVAVFGLAALLVRCVDRLTRSSTGIRAVREEAWAGACLAGLAVTTAACTLLGVQPIFGAFLLGVVVARVDERLGLDGRAFSAGRRLSLMIFVPIYFGAVGLTLDLRHQLDVGLTLAFVAAACAIKVGSVYVGARSGGEPRMPAANFAMAMNARGGPGIALATLALETGIVNERTYTTLVILALLTSVTAAAWLRFALSRGRPLRYSEAAEG